MHGGDYAWILPSDTIELLKTPNNSKEECTLSQLNQTLNGSIIINSHDSALENEITSSGLVSTFPVAHSFLDKTFARKGRRGEMEVWGNFPRLK